MPFSRPKLCIILLLSIATSYTATAQFSRDGWKKSWKTNNRFELKKPNFYERSHVGYTFHTVAAAQKMTNKFLGTETTRTARTLTGHGLTIGSYYILTRFKSDFAALAFSFDFNYNKLAWEELDSGFTYRPKLDEIKPTDFTVQMGIPMSLDLKLGSDAMPTLNHNWSASFGAGIYPMLAFTARQKKKVIRNSIDVAANYMPMVKLEGGMRIGVLMKLRLLLLFGGPEYLSENSTIDGMAITESNKYSLTNSLSTNIGLIVYPFSYNWPEYGWWQ